MDMANQEFRVYNSMSQQKEILTPNEPGKIRMYVCGITAYDLSHIGHARAAVAFDVLYRYLKYLNYEVTYVRNFTDVDDKIIRRAKENSEDPLTLSNRYCEKYRKDMDDLQCLPPTHEPRVSDHIDHIIYMITQIINNDYAYTVDGNVYFAVDRFPNYGRLSGRRLEDNRAGERVTIDSRKRNPADFALWKAEKKDEISWDSPWGRGRPGWHIECSAMSAYFLSCKFDIHGGGIDLFFPHHENEFAQSCAACQESNVGYWMHNGHVTYNNEKMSKSLGNFFTIHQITICYHPLALRYFLMSTQYRSPLNYSKAQLEYASDRVFYIFQTLQDCEVALSPFREGSVEGTKLNSKPALITPVPKAKVDELSSQLKTKKEELRSEFQTKMSDDLLTPPILNDALVDALRLVNRSLNMLKEKREKKHQLLRFQSLTELEEEIKEVLKVLGFLSSTVTYSEVLRQLKDKALTRAELDEDKVSKLIGKRAQARKNKDFALSDEIRNDLTARGISLMDVGSETIWKPCVRPELEEQSQPEST